MRRMGGEECIIQVNEGGDWMREMAEELNEVAQNLSEKSKRWKKTSIYKIPLSQKNAFKDASFYEPQMVAIGPYHHGKEQLRRMEEHKQRALLKFLDRSGKSLQHYARALAGSLEELKGAYDDDLQVSEEDFLKMLILDGCFMLELMRSSTDPSYAYGGEDPVFGSEHGRLYVNPHLMRDMLMLENQLPLLLLKELIKAEELWKEPREHELMTCILKFLGRRDRIRDIQTFTNSLHILDLYRKSLLKKERQREPERKKGKEKETTNEYKMRSATELRGAWIRLRKSKTSHLDDVKFKGRVLNVPRIRVDAATKHLYLNLMAFERLHMNAGNEVTSYVFFMDKLIDTAGDVSLLHWHGLMENLLSSDQDAADLFNSLSKDVCLDDKSVIFDVQKRVHKHYSNMLPYCMAYAQHTYFTNPWISLSVFAAFLLFALTILQTTYAVLDYYHK